MFSRILMIQPNKKSPEQRFTTGRYDNTNVVIFCKMAYNRQNILERVIEIQNITLEHTKRGCTQKWVFENIVRPRFFISWATYNNYLAMPAKAELKKLKAADNSQLKIDFE